MIKSLKQGTIVLFCLLLTAGGFAQGIAEIIPASQPPVEMATGLYQSGKIYVVVIVLSVIMAGILAYLIMIDRKLTKLEKEIKK
jgi:CcmD family protein